MLLKLDFAQDTPIYLQIRNQIVLGIANGELKPGEKLPPIRTLAAETGVNTMTVNKAYQLLKQEGYLEMDTDGFLLLTKLGKNTAEKIYERHKILSAALMALGVDPETAAEDACKIEHDISEKSLDAIRAHMKRYGKGTV